MEEYRSGRVSAICIRSSKMKQKGGELLSPAGRITSHSPLEVMFFCGGSESAAPCACTALCCSHHGFLTLGAKWGLHYRSEK